MHPHLKAWLDRDPDPETRQELEDLWRQKRHTELEARFGHRIAFGTAGLRALMGAGPSRMNRLIVRETTMGLAAVLGRDIPQAPERGVVVGYDGRHRSRLFAEDACQILMIQGFRVALFDRPVPTPLVGFCVRQRRAAAGLVITASHNPGAYNGLKIYWAEGAQIAPPLDRLLAQAIDHAAQSPLPSLPDFFDLGGLIEEGRFESLGDRQEADYLEALFAQTHLQQLQATGRSSQHSHNSRLKCPSPLAHLPLKLAYTALHGVGSRLTHAALAQLDGVTLEEVSSQRLPNGDFPNLPNPNPEDPQSLKELLALARTCQADLALAHDPDADRLAVAVRLEGANPSYQILTGDEIGLILASACLELNIENAVVATTLVSSTLLGKMAQEAGVHYFETLAGFKWLAQGMQQAQKRGQTLVLAYEEALGFALGDLLYDKDGIGALIAFVLVWARDCQQGQWPLERLHTVYCRHGHHATGQWTEQTTAATPHLWAERLRQSPPTHVAGRQVLAISDLLKGTEIREAESPNAQANPYSGWPTSDVLICTLASDPNQETGGARIMVRPSGTEPKIKYYYEVTTPVAADMSLAKAEHLGQMHLKTLMSAHRAEVLSASK